MRHLTLFLLLSVASSSLFAAQVFTSPIYSVKEKKFITFDVLEDELAQKDMVIIGELHNRETHHLNQKLILEGLEQRVAFNVGLEFVTWDNQMMFDKYQQGRMSQMDFITEVWGEGNFSFDWYKPLIESAARSGGWGYGINAPKLLTTKIGKTGLESLTALEQELMPPNFTLGSDLYRELFVDAMGGHRLPEDKFERYFSAHSTWDESMAYNALGRSSEELFVIIVGQFHIEYKLGLPARLKARSPELDLATVVQVEVQGQSVEDLMAELTENEKYGELGDYILITQ